MALLAHCVSYGVNALYEKADRYGGPGISQHGLERRLGQADRLAQAVGLDMVEAGWRPTVDNYLGRVTKRRILEAVREAKGERRAQLIDHLKKGDMAKEAERLLAGTGWLPEPLRRTTATSPRRRGRAMVKPRRCRNSSPATTRKTAVEEAEEPQPASHRGSNEPEPRGGSRPSRTTRSDPLRSPALAHERRAIFMSTSRRE